MMVMPVMGHDDNGDDGYVLRVMGVCSDDVQP